MTHITETQVNIQMLGSQTLLIKNNNLFSWAYSQFGDYFNICINYSKKPLKIIWRIKKCKSNE